MAGMNELSRVVDGWQLHFNDGLVTQLKFDYAVTIDLGIYRAFRLESPFVFYSAGGTRHEIDPEGNPEEVAPCLLMNRATVRSAKARLDGRLEIDFKGGMRCLVPPGEAYEAWNYAGPDGLLIVSIPGGDLTIWSSVPQSDE